MITIKYEADNNCAAAYDGDKQIGICQYEASGQTWNIYHTSTDPEYGGRGIAGNLVKCLKEQADEAGIKLTATCWYAKKVLGL